MSPKRFRRGTYLLPTFFTVGNLFCGFWSIASAAGGELRQAAVLIVIAAAFDGLDGRVARLTGTTSDFGLEFDSLADIVSFGVAPAFLAFTWAPMPNGSVAIAFLFLACAAFRLARFNLQTKATPKEKRYFAGLPSPPAAGLIATWVFAFPAVSEEMGVGLLRMVLVAAAGGLMVSKFRYRSFKDIDLGRRRPSVAVLGFVAVIVAVRIHPEIAMLSIAAAYACSGPSAYLWGLVSRRRRTYGSEGSAEGSS